jgi:hypothetical protein
MVKYCAKIEVEVNNRKYLLTCDVDSPINDVKEALFQISKHVGSIEDMAKSAVQPKPEVNPQETSDAASQG